MIVLLRINNIIINVFNLYRLCYKLARPDQLLHLFFPFFMFRIHEYASVSSHKCLRSPISTVQTVIAISNRRTVHSPSSVHLCGQNPHFELQFVLQLLVQAAMFTDTFASITKSMNMLNVDVIKHCVKKSESDFFIVKVLWKYNINIIVV